MRSILSQPPRAGSFVGALLLVSFLATPGLPAADTPSRWTTGGDLSARFGYDSNVYLQDTAPSPSVAGAAPANAGSFVSSFAVKGTVECNACREFKFSASYSPEFVTYFSEHDEDYATHRAGLKFFGDVGIVKWQFQNSLTVIFGNNEGPTFGGVGGAPAIGGIPLRDRRDAVIYRNSFGAFHKHGKWFFRPAASSYIHDFRTVLRDPAEYPYYQNFLDRNDFNIGLDTGYKAFDDGYVFLAYRLGWQHEPHLPSTSYDYSNDYRRLLLGFEGHITSRTTLNLFAGPDWRHFNHNPPAGFDSRPRLFYLDGSLVHQLSRNDSLTLTARRYVQPAYGAASAYTDITYQGVYRRTFNDAVSGYVGFKAYGGEWLAPVMRRDWIYTPSAGLSFKGGRKLTVDITWSSDRAVSHVPDKPGREFTRQLVSLGVRLVL